MKTKEPREVQKYPELWMHSSTELHLHYPDGTYEYYSFFSGQWIIAWLVPRHIKMRHRISANNLTGYGWIFLEEIK